MPDTDEAGRGKEKKAAEALRKVAASVRTLHLPGLTGEKDSKDVSNWLDAGDDKETLLALAQSAPLYEYGPEAEKPKPKPEPISPEVADAFDPERGPKVDEPPAMDDAPPPMDEAPEAEAEKPKDDEEVGSADEEKPDAEEPQPQVKEEKPKAEEPKAKAQWPRLIKTSGEFVKDFVPPDYLIDGILQRRFIYSLTGQTGSGKTAVALLWAYCIATGTKIGPREVEAGRVIYFAGENPDDIRQRWIAMAEHYKFDIDTIDVHFIPGVLSLMQMRERIKMEIAESGPATAIFVDTSAAYFEGKQENDNVELGNHARLMRKYTRMPGGPTVIVNCHPPKGAGPENLIPRGGGAFLAEVDGNLTCALSEGIIRIGTQGKFRGAEFSPLHLELRTGTTERLKDTKGRKIFSVYAAQLTDEEVAERTQGGRDNENRVLRLMLAADPKKPLSIADIANNLGWRLASGEPHKRKVHGILQELLKHKLVEQERGGSYALTSKGKATAQALPPEDDDVFYGAESPGTMRNGQAYSLGIF